MSTVFEVSKLRKNFGGLAVTNDVSLSMAKGDRVALIGPNGAGKTTFVNLVTGNLPATSGTVTLGGENVSKLNAMQRVRRGLVRSFQVTRLFFDMTPEEHVALAILQREGKTGRILGDYHKMPGVMDEVRDILRSASCVSVRSLMASNDCWKSPWHWRCVPKCFCWTNRLPVCRKAIRAASKKHSTVCPPISPFS
jgi:branched-chain amino acid transport system ATP-binding protein